MTKKIFNLYFDPPTTRHDDMFRLRLDTDAAYIADDDIATPNKWTSRQNVTRDKLPTLTDLPYPQRELAHLDLDHSDVTIQRHSGIGKTLTNQNYPLLAIIY